MTIWGAFLPKPKARTWPLAEWQLPGDWKRKRTFDGHESIGIVRPTPAVQVRSVDRPECDQDRSFTYRTADGFTRSDASLLSVLEPKGRSRGSSVHAPIVVLYCEPPEGRK
jgi:hypothetical protein